MRQNAAWGYLALIVTHLFVAILALGMCRLTDYGEGCKAFVELLQSL